MSIDRNDWPPCKNKILLNSLKYLTMIQEQQTDAEILTIKNRKRFTREM